MNYLTMVKNVRLLSGMQGTGPSSVSNAVGVDQVIVQMVKDVYKDIQNMREEWPWLINKVSFSTTAGKHIYTLADIFSSATNNLKDYKPKSFLVTEGGNLSYLQEIDEDQMEAMYLNDTGQAVPSRYSIDYTDYSVELRSIPDGSYTINFSYYQIPQELTTDTDVPLMPQAYHDLIVYKALERLSIYLSTPEIFSNYSMETGKMEGRLLRGTLKPKRITMRPFA